jgi:hypothetical protein
VGSYAGRQNFNQAYLGHGYITTVTDYGASAGLTDAQLIEKVKHESDGRLSTQALNICDKENNVCKAVLIQRNSGGYSAKAVY